MIDDHTDDVDSMLEQWELIKSSSPPKYRELCGAIENEFAKFEIDKVAAHLRASRMAHSTDEEAYVREFVKIFNKFGENIIYRILKG